MKNSSVRNKLILFAFIALAVIIAGAVLTAKFTYQTKLKQEQLKLQKETFTEPDYYSMQNYCRANADAVMAALKEGSKDSVKALMISSDGLDDVMTIADWSTADFENAVSMGSGSIATEPDDEGKMDVGERFFVDTEQNKFVLYIETVTSSWGRINDGVSAVAVISYKDFDDEDYAWNGEPVDGSVLAGKLFREQSS